MCVSGRVISTTFPRLQFSDAISLDAVVSHYCIFCLANGNASKYFFAEDQTQFLMVLLS